jgi:predicted metal-dependent peptidase/predicted RNA-binding Zn-ribbon protein involved in translation (DUF1610 family)
MDVDKIRSDYDKLKATMAIDAPFISSLLSRARIVVSRSVPIAAVSRDGVIIVNPDFWAGASWSEKAWVLGHEIFHLAFRDHKRRGGRNHTAWNICTDAVNNEILNDMLRMPSSIGKMTVTMEKLYAVLRDVADMNYESFSKLSKEELYRLIPKTRGREPPRCPRCGSERVRCRKLERVGDRIVAHMVCEDCGYRWDADVEAGGEEGYPIPVDEVEGDVGLDASGGDPVQDGDGEIYSGGRERGQADEAWNTRIAKAYSMQKTIGRVPLGLERLVESILKPKIDWRSLLKQAFRLGVGRFVVETYRRPSRKCDEFPGLRRYTTPTVWVLVDRW